MKPPSSKIARQSREHKTDRSKPFEEKESYRWIEALKAVAKQFQEVQKQLAETSELIDQKTRIIHIFDREGDIALSL